MTSRGSPGPGGSLAGAARSRCLVLLIGSVLALVPTGCVGTVRAAVTETFIARGWLPPEFLDAVPSPPARQLF